MQTLLTVDIGNTELKFGLFQQGRLLRHWRLERWRERSEPLQGLLERALAQADMPFDALAYCSVVPELEGTFRSALDCYRLRPAQILHVNPRSDSSATLKLPVDFSRYAPGQLGADRLVNTCGAAILYPQEPLIVVSFGTATTFDFLMADGRYRGGAIAPGWRTFIGVLNEKTAQLPLISFEHKRFEELELGLSTQACLETGLGLGYRGLILELLQASQRQLKAENCKIVATGGLLQEVRTVCGLETLLADAQPTLTLGGLAALYAAHTGGYLAG
jgi:type III pantothenate kinase